MKSDRFDLNLLIALDALLAEKNVTHAGIRIHLSQSAMSGSLGRLRDFFQDELLVPVGRGMALTPLAQGLVTPVRHILLQVQAAITTKPRFDPATSKRHFSVALSDYTMAILMIDALREIKRLAPHIAFELRPVGERADEALESGTLDFLIVPDNFTLDGHPKMPLFEDTHTCIAWTGNSCVGAKISLDEYLKMGHITVYNTEGQRSNFVELFFKRLKYKKRSEVSTHSFDAVPHLVVGTDRIATVFTRLATKYAKFLPLKLIPPPVEIPVMVQMLQWHKYHDNDPAYIWLRERFKEAAAKLPGLSAGFADEARPPARRLKVRHAVA